MLERALIEHLGESGDLANKTKGGEGIRDDENYVVYICVRNGSF